MIKNNNNMIGVDLQGGDKNLVLEDKRKDGKIRPWREKKVKSIELAESYKRLNLDGKYVNVAQCSSYLNFKKFDDGSRKLIDARFCKDRLCSMCAWRRELKIFKQVSKVIQSINSENKYRFLFLTLTCENVSSEELKTRIDVLLESYKRMFKLAHTKKVVKGWFRALEVTHDVEKYITYEMYFGDKKRHLKSRKKYYDGLGLKIGDLNPNHDMYHPHLHVVLMVSKSYFSDVKLYTTQKQWTSLWKESMKCNYIPIVHIQPFKKSNGKEVAEVSKYTVKDADFLVKKDLALTDKTVLTLVSALHNRRLVAFGGLLKDEHKRLNLSEIDDNLINTDDDCISDELNYIIEKYNWHIGYTNYVMQKL